MYLHLPYLSILHSSRSSVRFHQFQGTFVGMLIEYSPCHCHNFIRYLP